LLNATPATAPPSSTAHCAHSSADRHFKAPGPSHHTQGSDPILPPHGLLADRRSLRRVTRMRPRRPRRPTTFGRLAASWTLTAPHAWAGAAIALRAASEPCVEQLQRPPRWVQARRLGRQAERRQDRHQHPGLGDLRVEFAPPAAEPAAQHVQIAPPGAGAGDPAVPSESVAMARRPACSEEPSSTAGNTSPCLRPELCVLIGGAECLRGLAGGP